MMQEQARIPTDEQRLLKKKDVAEQKNVCVRTVDYWLQRGWLPHVKLGRAVRIIQSDLDQFIQSHRIGGGK
jgi:excisionase family DNA binding protein